MAYDMLHMKNFAERVKQLLVNKAVYWDNSPWVAAMFSIFGECACVCVWSWSSMLSWGLGCEHFLNASESPSSCKITAPWSLLFLLSLSPLACTLMARAPFEAPARHPLCWGIRTPQPDKCFLMQRMPCVPFTSLIVAYKTQNSLHVWFDGWYFTKTWTKISEKHKMSHTERVLFSVFLV